MKKGMMATFVTVAAASVLFLGLGVSGVLGEGLGDKPACNGGSCAINWQKNMMEESGE